jgi:hypothetical protein
VEKTRAMNKPIQKDEDDVEGKRENKNEHKSWFYG